MPLKMGLIHYYYGNGKGKTTAAMGLALRAMGNGLRVLIVQFLKNGTSAEVKMLKQMGANVLAVEGIAGFSFQMTEEQKQACAAEQNLNLEAAAAAVAEGSCDVLVLDEIGSALSLDMVSRERLESLLEKRHPSVEVVMTGHKLDPMLHEKADYVTRMEKQKHPFDRGIIARKGIEF
ncbi:MAG: cob(I)yrinic acid a,c-diamide adenosyltransferase [Candidatus Merdivicinus sp.]|jgi:cob(I)alamin adenosyltransferase